MSKLFANYSIMNNEIYLGEKIHVVVRQHVAQTRERFMQDYLELLNHNEQGSIQLCLDLSPRY